MNKDMLHEFEQKECQLQEIVNMLLLVYKNYYGNQQNNLYIYDRLVTALCFNSSI